MPIISTETVLREDSEIIHVRWRFSPFRDVLLRLRARRCQVALRLAEQPVGINKEIDRRGHPRDSPTRVCPLRGFKAWRASLTLTGAAYGPHSLPLAYSVARLSL